MELLTLIDDSHAITSNRKGVLKQTQLYRRGGKVYVPHSGGFVEVRCRGSFSKGEYSTACPDIKLVDFEAEHVVITKMLGQDTLRWHNAPQKVE